MPIIDPSLPPLDKHIWEQAVFRFIARLGTSIRDRYGSFPVHLGFAGVQGDDLVFEFKLGEEKKSVSRDLIEVTTFGDAYRRFVPGTEQVTSIYEEIKLLKISIADVARCPHDSFYEFLEERILLFIHDNYGQELLDDEDP